MRVLKTENTTGPAESPGAGPNPGARRVATVAELAALFGGEVEGDGSLVIQGPAGLEDAGAGDVSFLAQANYVAHLETTRASAVLLERDIESPRSDLVVIRCDDPERAFTQVILHFAPVLPSVPTGQHQFAVVHASASVAPGARIAEHVSVGEGAVIGDRVTLHAGTRVGAYAVVGDDSVLHANVVLYPYTEVGERCILHAGSAVGSDGFGFHHDGTGWKKTPQVGRVVLEDDVELGSNVSIDCARFGATRVGRGSKLDNQVHIAHNVQIGRDCLLIAQVGVAGSSVLEDGVILAGQVGVSGHLRVGAGARIAGGSGVTKSVPAGEEWFGYPAGPRRDKLRKLVRAERAGDDIKALRRELETLREEVKALRGDAPA